MGFSRLPGTGLVGLLLLLLSSQPRAEPSPSPKAGTITSVAETTWIYSEPDRKDTKAIGYLRVGQSVRIRDGEPVVGSGCGRGFLAVEPFGFICQDRTAAVAPSRRDLQAMALLKPSLGVFPFRYALSNGTPMYRRLPTREEWEVTERYWGTPGTHAPMSWGNRGHEQLAEERQLTVDGEVPFYFLGGGTRSEGKSRSLVRQDLPLGSMVAFSRVFEHQGRAWLAAADGTAVPADRVRPFRESTFKGVVLGQGVELPLAWIRGRPRAQYEQSGAGELVAGSALWPAKSWVALDPSVAPVTQSTKQGPKTYLATRERRDGKVLWLAQEDAAVVAPREHIPWEKESQAKGLFISITGGTLVAYEGRRPVFTTLISPGAGGVPVPGKDPVKMSTTPLGVFRIAFKHRSTTMSPETGDHRSFWIEEVPYAQYFQAPFAIHVAYWHENFGEPMSAGCVNVSPLDGQWLFNWTAPQVPAEWSGVGPSSFTGKGSWVVVQR